MKISERQAKAIVITVSVFFIALIIADVALAIVAYCMGKLEIVGLVGIILALGMSLYFYFTC